VADSAAIGADSRPESEYGNACEGSPGCVIPPAQTNLRRSLRLLRATTAESLERVHVPTDKKATHLVDHPTISVASAIVSIAANCAKGDAGARNAVLTKASTMQQQKPIKLRYYGGPKYPMYPE
jgi:hypothetical protein